MPIAFKGKGKPRGKPFQKGHKLGNRFKPGQSGNPNGTSQLQCLTTELRRQLPQVADELIARTIKRALKDTRTVEMLWNRAEGPVETDHKITGDVTITVRYNRSEEKNPPTDA